MGIEFMQENEIKFSRTEGGILALEYLGEKYPDIILQRAFPLSKPFEYISVKTSAVHKDMSNELGIIRDVSKLSEENRNIVKEELAQRYFVPVITKIETLKDEFGQVYMDVVTDAGKKKITGFKFHITEKTHEEKQIIMGTWGIPFEDILLLEDGQRPDFRDLEPETDLPFKCD